VEKPTIDSNEANGYPLLESIDNPERTAKLLAAGAKIMSLHIRAAIEYEFIETLKLYREHDQSAGEIIDIIWKSLTPAKQFSMTLRAKELAAIRSSGISPARKDIKHEPVH
jgi:hypothetical protein